MGYSVFTLFPSSEAQERMLAFLLHHYTDFGKLTGDHKYQPAVTYPTVEVSYDGDYENALKIGFDYNASGPERAYAFSICYWMSMMAGDQKNFDQFKDMPYIVYDGVEEWPLFLEKPEGFQGNYAVVDKIGFRPFTDSLSQSIFGKRYMKQIDLYVLNELKRLTALWVEHKIEAAQ